ncbi:hypothetical protein EDD85DRAFT_979286 [Armillaria nabsnona]|nr:hypothetical protein EDD85DRAFT_979286 [Armillaria nabsnona]
MPLLDRDEAERLPVVIPQEVIDNNPDAFAWYEGPHVNETPMGYLHYIVDKCSSYTKDIHSAFFDAIDTYSEGLKEYARDHYAEFIVPGFAKKHRGKRLQECRDKPWMEWMTKKPYLTQKYTVYFTAVQYSLDDTRHYIANRDIGELLSTTEYEDDSDLVEEDDEYEMDSFINDGPDTEEEHEEEESSETVDDSESSSSAAESTQLSDVEGSQSNVSGGIDSEPYVQTPPRKIHLNGTANLGSAYRLGKRLAAGPMPPSPTPRKRRQVPGTSKVNSVSKASPRKRRFLSVDSSDHLEDLDDAEEVKPTPKERCRRRKRGPPKAAHRPRKGKQKALSSEMEIFISGSEESNGNEDYAGSATENDNLSDLADGAESRQLCSGRKYGPNKSTPSKEIASKSHRLATGNHPGLSELRYQVPLIPGRTNPTGSARDPVQGERLAQMLSRRCRNEGVQPTGWFRVRRMICTSFVLVMTVTQDAQWKNVGLLRPKGLRLIDSGDCGDGLNAPHNHFLADVMI